MMKATDHRLRDDWPIAERLRLPPVRGIPTKRLMTSRRVVVFDESVHKPDQVGLIQNDAVIEALSAGGTTCPAPFNTP